MNMEHNSAELLEFEPLKAVVGRYVAGPLGRAELDRVQPIADRAALEESLAEVAEAIEFTRTVGKLPLTGLVDSTISVQKLRIEGATLEGKEIGDLITFLERTTEIRSQLASESEKFLRLAQRANTLGDFRPLLRDVSGKILPNGLVADNASVALNRLRRDIEKQQRHIHESLERFLRAHRDDGILQEDYVAIRNDRFV